MLFHSLDALCDRLTVLMQPLSAQHMKKGDAIFILLPDRAAWGHVLRMLRATDMRELRLSDLRASHDRLPTAAHILARLEQGSGPVLLTPAGELLRHRAFSGCADFFSRLTELRRSGGNLFVPVLGCSAELRRLGIDSDLPTVLQLAGEDERSVPCFVAAGLPVNDAIDLTAWLRMCESPEPVSTALVQVSAPHRFAGMGARTIGSCYELLSTRLYALEFVADERALSPQQWHDLYTALEPTLPEPPERITAREALMECAQREARGELHPGHPLRPGAWLHALTGLHSGPYLRRIMRVEPHYSSLAEAVALELLAEFDDGDDREPGALSPSRVSAHEWLDVRAERAAMLEALGITRLPERYWQLLERVPRRRKLLYSSLRTDDERAFCREYLMGEFHLSSRQLAERDDLKRLYPELAEEARNHDRSVQTCSAVTPPTPSR